MKSIKESNVLQNVKSKIENLDLGAIKFKMMHPEEGEGWSRDKVIAVEKEYKRFLFLTFKYQGINQIVPEKDVDEMWHYHILDTYKYAEDCENIFGYFLHHFPYFGLRGEADNEALHESFQLSINAYEETFNEPSPRKLTDTCCSCGGSGCSACSAITPLNKESIMKPHIRPTFLAEVA